MGLEAIYAIFGRKKILPLLRGNGRFNREDLASLIWSNYTLEEQKVFLGMMESCGICFKVRELQNDEWEYIALELLPEWSGAQEELLGRLRDDPPDTEASARYAFLHEGILRGYLSKLGEQAKDGAIYWKYGCWFYEQKTRSQVLIESHWNDAESKAGSGAIRFRAWGENAQSLIGSLLEALQEMRVGQPPEITRTKTFSAHANRVEYAEHWETRCQKLKSKLDYLSVEDFRLYQNMKKWCVDVGKMLSHITDVLNPHGFENIVKDDFAGLREMLKRRR